MYDQSLDPSRSHRVFNLRSSSDTGTIGMGGEKRSTSLSPRTTATSSSGHLTHDNKSGTTGHEQYQLSSSFATAPARAEITKLGGQGKRNSPARAGYPVQQPENEPQQTHRYHQHHQRDDHRNPHPHHDHPLHHRDHHHHGHQTGSNVSEVGCRSCWDSEGVVQAYRSVAAAAVRRLSSALFGEELQAIETAKTVAVERERMLQTKARETFESQVRYTNFGTKLCVLPVYGSCKIRANHIFNPIYRLSAVGYCVERSSSPYRVIRLALDNAHNKHSMGPPTTNA